MKSRKIEAMEVDGATITAIAGATGTVATAVGAALKILWGKVTEQHKAVEQQLTDCHQEHKRAAEKIDVIQRDVITLSRTVGRLEGAVKARGIDPDEITE